MVLDCPKCGLVNPPTAVLCDCGYNFKTRQHDHAPGPGLGQPSIFWTMIIVSIIVFALMPLLCLITGIVSELSKLGEPFYVAVGIVVFVFLVFGARLFVKVLRG